MNKQKQVNLSRSKFILSTKENYPPNTTTEPTLLHPSKVWQYATRLPNSNYSTCDLCPDKKKISTNNGSTSTLRKHLIAKHGIQELKLPIQKKKPKLLSIDPKRKNELHSLFINYIINN